MYLVFSYLATHQVLTLTKLCHRLPISAAWKAQKLPTQHPAYSGENPIDLVPKGSTKAKENAKQNWYVGFFL
jgi:hypothetical protein